MGAAGWRETYMKLSSFEAILAATSFALLAAVVWWGIEILHRM
jgi:hypothetical protein